VSVGRVVGALSGNLDAALACGFGHFLYSEFSIQHFRVLSCLFALTDLFDGWQPLWLR